MNYELLSVIRIGTVIVGAIVAFKALYELRVLLMPGPAPARSLRNSAIVAIAFFVAVYAFVTSDALQRATAMQFVRPIFLYHVIRWGIRLVRIGWRALFPPAAPVAGAAPAAMNPWVSRIVAILIIGVIMFVGVMVLFDGGSVMSVQSVSSPVVNFFTSIGEGVSKYISDTVDYIELLANQDTGGQQPALFMTPLVANRQDDSGHCVYPVTVTARDQARIRSTMVLDKKNRNVTGQLRGGTPVSVLSVTDGWAAIGSGSYINTSVLDDPGCAW